MHIPPNIMVSIIATSKLSAAMRKHSEVVRNWLWDNNLANDGNIDQFIDSCEMGDERYDKFIQYLHSEQVVQGNDLYYSVR